MIDAQLFRACLGRFATGVTVVTSQYGQERHGMTVNSFTSVSLDPPLVLFCPFQGARIMELIEKSQVFAISVLSEEQMEHCQRFAGQTELEDRFQGLECQQGQTGCPLFKGSLAHLECRVHQTHPAGDHTLVVGEVLTLECQEGQPLLFFSGTYPKLAID